jgi:hypothetical protein
MLDFENLDSTGTPRLPLENKVSLGKDLDL